MDQRGSAFRPRCSKGRAALSVSGYRFTGATACTQSVARLPSSVERALSSRHHLPLEHVHAAGEANLPCFRGELDDYGLIQRERFSDAVIREHDLRPAGLVRSADEANLDRL